MEQEAIAQQLAFGIGLILLGLAGWLLPYEFNVLRFKRLIASRMSEAAQRRVPRIVGSLCLALGIAILIGTAVVGKFE